MVSPDCPYYESCGGCASQHIDYEEQKIRKQDQVKTRLGISELDFFSDKPYHYRNRMNFIFHQKGLGLRSKKKNSQIIPINGCSIANDKVNALLTEINRFFTRVDSYNSKRKSGTFRYAVIRTGDSDSSISFVLNEDSSQLQGAIEKIKSFAEKTTADNIIVTYVLPESEDYVSGEYFVVKGKDELRGTLLDFPFDYSVQGFYQNNPVVANMMHKYCHDILKTYDTKDATLLDLYGGVGTFGIINSSLFKHTETVEGFAPCLPSTMHNIELNKERIGSIHAQTLDAKRISKLDLQSPLFLLTDPPRSGMDPKVLEEIRSLQPEVILYVSCNLEKLDKDIKKLQTLYNLKKVALFDFFPHTWHYETVVLLEKKN